MLISAYEMLALRQDDRRLSSESDFATNAKDAAARFMYAATASSTIPRTTTRAARPQAERVVDKERFNFCEYFVPGSGKGAGAAAQSKSAAQAKLEALFKKK